MSVSADDDDTGPKEPLTSDNGSGGQAEPLANDPEATAPDTIPPDESNRKLIEEDGPF